VARHHQATGFEPLARPTARWRLAGNGERQLTVTARMPGRISLKGLPYRNAEIGTGGFSTDLIPGPVRSPAKIPFKPRSAAPVQILVLPPVDNLVMACRSNRIKTRVVVFKNPARAAHPPARLLQKQLPYRVSKVSSRNRILYFSLLSACLWGRIAWHRASADHRCSPHRHRHGRHCSACAQLPASGRAPVIGHGPLPQMPRSRKARKASLSCIARMAYS